MKGEDTSGHDLMLTALLSSTEIESFLNTIKTETHSCSVYLRLDLEFGELPIEIVLKCCDDQISVELVCLSHVKAVHNTAC